MSDVNIQVKITANASGMAAGINQGEAALQAFTEHCQKMSATMQAGFNQTNFILRSMASSMGEAGSAASRMSERVKPTTSGMVAGFGAIGLAISGIKQSVELVGQAINVALGPSAQMQSLQVQFGVLLGSTKAAKERMQELANFSDTTPFELPEVSKASKVLETLTKGALSTGEGLRMVGDVAAATGQPFDELATWFGRLYDGLQSGRPVGEAMQRLQELGAVSGDTRAQIEQLQKEGKKGPEVWDVAKQSFEQYSGMMEAQSKTFEGMASTMQDSLGGVMREFGNEILPTASGATADLTGFFNDLKPAAQALGWVVRTVVQEFRLLFVSLKTWFQDVIPLMYAELGRAILWVVEKLVGLGEKVNSLFGGILPESMTKGLSTGLASAKQWAQDMGGVLKTVADDSKASLSQFGDKVRDIYSPAEDIDVPGKKAGTSGRTGGGVAGKPVGTAEGKSASVDYLKASGMAKEHNALQNAAFNDQKKREAQILKDEEEKKKIADKALKDSEAKQTAYMNRMMQLSESVSGAFSNIAKNMTTMALKGDFTLKALGSAFKDMMIGMIADLVAFIVKTLAQVALLAAADALTGGMVSAVLGASKGGIGGGGILGFASGGLLSFDVGTPSVPRDMVAQIHQGEMIIPKTFAEGIRKGDVPLGGAGTSDHSASLVLPDDILSAIATKGSALVKIMNKQGRVSFA